MTPHFYFTPQTAARTRSTAFSSNETKHRSCRTRSSRFVYAGMASPAILARTSGGTKEGLKNSVTIGVADEHIGAVVGRAGKNITEISQVSGARIKISDRGDFIAGTSERKVTITGSPEAIRVAEAMIMQKVSASANSET